MSRPPLSHQIAALAIWHNGGVPNTHDGATADSGAATADDSAGAIAATRREGEAHGIPGIRARNRAAIEAEILTTARHHLGRQGASSLSLRAIARDLGMASSAIYRYVDHRDELLTRLIVAAYDSLGDAVETAHDAVPPQDLRARWDAAATAVLTWGRTHPHEYALVHGSPVPDYDAPTERTTAAGTRVQQVLLRLAIDSQRVGRLPRRPSVTSDIARSSASAWLEDEFFAGTDLEPETLTAAFAAWTLLIGTVSSLVFGQLGPVPDEDAHARAMFDVAGSLVLGDE